jgi:hypothetical protein
MHMTYHVTVESKDLHDGRSFWFQSGKLTLCPDYSKPSCNYKDFRTKKKLESFLRWLDSAYPDTIVSVLEIRSDGRWAYDIPMGDDWKKWRDNNINKIM